MMTVNVDRLSRPERLLWGHGVRMPEHIDLEAIASARGAHIVYRKLDGCAARLVAAGDRAVISVAADDNLGRRRFSLGHELAHWIQDAQRASFKCSSTDISPQNAEAKTIEADANNFASQLILPDFLVWPWVADRKPSLDLANAMGGDFQASLTASALKLLQRAQGAIAITCHDQRRLKWSRRSRNFSTDFYILNELHQDTIAFDMAFGAAKGLSRLKRESASRWISGPGTYRMEVWSQSIKLPEGSVLTMLSVV
jgi:Zn-dependent peptidase ImmA (M78 family)